MPRRLPILEATRFLIWSANTAVIRDGAADAHECTVGRSSLPARSQLVLAITLPVQRRRRSWRGLRRPAHGHRIARGGRTRFARTDDHTRAGQRPLQPAPLRAGNPTHRDDHVPVVSSEVLLNLVAVPRYRSTAPLPAPRSRAVGGEHPALLLAPAAGWARIARMLRRATSRLGRLGSLRSPPRPSRARAAGRRRRLPHGPAGPRAGELPGKLRRTASFLARL